MYVYQLEMYRIQYNGVYPNNKTLGMFTSKSKAIAFAEYWQEKKLRFEQISEWSIIKSHSKEYKTDLIVDSHNEKWNVQYFITQYHLNPTY